MGSGSWSPGNERIPRAVFERSYRGDQVSVGLHISQASGSRTYVFREDTNRLYQFCLPAVEIHVILVKLHYFYKFRQGSAETLFFLGNAPDRCPTVLELASVDGLARFVFYFFYFRFRSEIIGFTLFLHYF